MHTPIISLRDVHLSLPSNAGVVHILKNVDLTVHRGETVGLIGPSGSGKSSLLMLMGGLEQASSGKVDVLGQDLSILNEDALARFRRSHMGIVFQSFHLIPTMTALENVATPLELAGVKDAMERARAELAEVGLAERGGHFPAQLSGGNSKGLLWRALPFCAQTFFWQMSPPVISTGKMVQLSWTCCFHCVKNMDQLLS